MLLSESRDTSVDAVLEERCTERASVSGQAGLNVSEVSLQSGRKIAKL